MSEHAFSATAQQPHSSTLCMFLHLPNVSLSASVAARCRWKGRSQRPTFSRESPRSLPVTSPSCGVSSAWFLGVAVPRPPALVGKCQAGCWGRREGRSPHTIDLTIKGVLGNPASQVGTEDPQLWAVCLAPRRERISELGPNPRFSFWLPQDGHHGFRFPSRLPELMLRFLSPPSCYKTVHGFPTGHRIRSKMPQIFI